MNLKNKTKTELITMVDYYMIQLIDTFDTQEIIITDKKEALEVAERLKFFFLKQGKKIDVFFFAITQGEAQYDSNQEYSHSLEDTHLEIMI